MAEHEKLIVLTNNQTNIQEPGDAVNLWTASTKTIVTALLLFFCSTSQAAVSELVIAANPVDGQQRLAFHEQIKAFELTHPNVRVRLKAFEHESFKESVNRNIASNKTIADILFWFGGASLRHFADNGWLQDLSHLWQDEDWNQSFSRSAKKAVSRSGKQYGLPLYYYQWGMYYRKSIFEANDLSPPETWADFLEVSYTLRDRNITPITLGSKNHWTAAGWFDYINLRLNGLDFHHKLLNGCVSFTDKRVKHVFEHLKKLVDANFFLYNAHELDWKNALPYLYHGKTAMLLMGNFFTASVPKRIRDDIGFFPFPKIAKDVALYEDAPVDVLIVPKNAKNKETAYAFLKYMATPEPQSQLARALSMIPPNRHAELADDEQIRQGAELLSKAEGLAQFFDRDTHPEFTQKALPLIRNFIRRADKIYWLQEQLEKARLEVWPEMKLNDGGSCDNY